PDLYASPICSLLFFTDPAPTELYTLSLHDALPIYLTLVDQLHRALADDEEVVRRLGVLDQDVLAGGVRADPRRAGHRCKIGGLQDRKSTRLNSSHVAISYAVFCLKKKKEKATQTAR